MASIRNDRAGERPDGTPARRTAGGFTLIEFLVALVLIGLVAASAVRGIQSLARSDLRSAAGRLAGAMRYLFDRASTTGKIHRLVLDFDESKYSVEVSDDRFYMPRDRETELSRQAEFERIQLEQEERQRRIEQGLPADLPEEQDDQGGMGFGFGAPSMEAGAYTIDRYLPKPYERKATRWKPFRENTVKAIALKKVALHDLFTPRLAEAQTAGKGYIYFFPLGFTEAAIVHLSDEEQENYFSLILHPLTGRVKVVGGYVDPPIEEQVDDEGNVREP